MKNKKRKFTVKMKPVNTQQIKDMTLEQKCGEINTLLNFFGNGILKNMPGISSEDLWVRIQDKTFLVCQIYPEIPDFMKKQIPDITENHVAALKLRDDSGFMGAPLTNEDVNTLLEKLRNLGDRIAKELHL